MFEKIKTPSVLWISYGLFLVFLYIAATTDLVIKEKTKVVYPISILSENLSEEYAGNLKKGIFAAADEFNVDLSYITTTPEMKTEDKISMIREEIELGTKAIIIGEEERDEISAELGDIVKDVPIITIGNRSSLENINNVYVDAGSIASLIVENITKRYDSSKKVVFLFSEEDDFEEVSIVNFAEERLKEEGFFCHALKWDNRYNPFYNDKIVITLNKVITTEFVKKVEEQELRTSLPLIYGVGSTTFLLNKLDLGRIAGLVAWDDFALGYVSVESAVNLIKLPIGRKREKIDCFFLDKEILDSGKYMKVLYQISERGLHERQGLLDWYF